MIVNLDNARIRKATGQKLIDPKGIVAPESMIQARTWAQTPTGLIVYIRDVRFIEGKRRAFFMVNGIQQSELVANLTPTQLAKGNPNLARP